MSKRKYWGRFTAMGVAGLTAVSSMAVVAQAATQETLIYELKYNGVANIGMVNTAGYATKTNQFCIGTKYKMNQEFEVDLATKFAAAGSETYTESSVATNGEGKDYINKATKTLTADEIWGTNNFKQNENHLNASKVWTYQEFNDQYTLAAATFGELYGSRESITASFSFKTASDRSAAQNAMIAKIKSEYDKLAKKAYDQFSKDIDAQVKIAHAHIKTNYETDVSNANAQTGLAKTAALSTAQAKRSAADSAVNTRARIIKDEFRKTFTSNNFRIATDGFASSEAAIEFTSSFAGVTTPATYTPTGGTSQALTGAKYYNASTKYNNPGSYAFKGEIQLEGNYKAENVNALCISGNDWLNYEIINYTANSGGNTAPGGGTVSTTTPTNTATSAVNTWYPTAGTYRMSNTRSYLGLNGYYYTSESAANLYGTGYSGTSVSSNYDSSRPYFNADTGLYYSSDSGMAHSYKVENAAISGNSFYNSATGRYYVSESAARSANSSGTITGYTRATGSYFNSKTGYYYDSLDAAANASSINDVVTSGGSTVSTSGDPYYYYYLQQQYKNPYGTGSTVPSTSTVPDGSVSIYGTSSSRYAGWNNVTSYISSAARRGSTVKLDMNDEGSVPSQVVSAAKNKNITLRVVNDNGAYWTIAPGNVDTAKDFNSSIVYNTKNIKSSLVKKAKQVNEGTVSTAQITVGGNYSSSLGFTAGVTVKLPAKRSGCTVKAYRLDGSRLVCDAKSKVQSSGAVTLNLDTAGSYLLVVVD